MTALAPLSNTRLSGTAFRLPFTLVLFALALSLAAVPAQAQSSRGNIAGTVVDATTGKFLEGADVSVEGTDLHVAAEREGRFLLRDVPSGPRILVVTYPGLESASAAVTVAPSQIATTNIRLGSGSIVQLAEFKVAGTKEGMAQAIALQKSSDQIKVVAAGDQYGDIAEGNAAEYLKFLPGVGIDYNANDARAATLRGMNTAFTNVTMNGNPIASATSGNANRRFEFEQVAINNVESVEVFKTLTPEMQATSTGGSINLVTKSAFDRQGSLFTYRTYLQATDSDLYLKKTEGWGQEQTRKILPGVDLNYASRLTESLGFNIAYKNSQLFNNYPRSSYSYQYNPASGGNPDNPGINSWNLQNEQKNTRRQSMSGQVDYRLAERTKLSVNGQWNYYDLLFTDRVLTITPGALPALSNTGTPSYSGNTFTGPTGGGSAAIQTINRSKSGVTWSTGANLTHEFAGGSKLEGSTYWSQAYSKYRDTSRSWFSDATMTRTGLTVKFTNLGETVPTYALTDNTGTVVDLRDVTKFNLTQVRSRPQTGVDTKDGASLDFKTPLGSLPATVKIGARVDETGRNIDNRVFNRTGTSVATGFGGAAAVTGNPLANLVDYGFSNHGIGYGLPAYNFLSVYQAYSQLGGNSYLPYTPASDLIARFDEQTKSTYVRFDVKPVTNVLVVAGARYEDRSVDIENRLSTLPRILTGKFEDKSWFPSLNLKYNLTRNLQLRFGAAKSIGLPDYGDLTPGLPTITDPTSTARGRVAIFNPKLEAFSVTNYDASVEYFFGQGGLISASIFRKTFKNSIVDATQTLDDATAANLGIAQSQLNASYDQYDASYKFNIPDTGNYNGIELSYAQRFTFLPKPFNTLGLQMNATLLSVDPIKTNRVLNNSVTDPNLNAALLNTVNKNLEIAAVKRAFNVVLNYSIGKFGFTATSNYTGKVLKAANRVTVRYNNEPANRYRFEYLYQAPRELVDLRVDYKHNRRFTPYFQARNVFGRAIVTSTPYRPQNRAEYGDPIYELGVRGVW
ncbi:MAG: TonB-dependent receptor [Opitutaceae bacterium]